MAGPWPFVGRFGSALVVLSPLDCPAGLTSTCGVPGCVHIRLRRRTVAEPEQSTTWITAAVRLPPNNAYLPRVSLSICATPSGRAEDWHRAATPLRREDGLAGMETRSICRPGLRTSAPGCATSSIASDTPILSTAHLIRVSPTAELVEASSKAIARGLTVTKVLEPELVTRCPAKTDERVEAGRRQRITVRGCDNRTILDASDGRRCSTWRYCPSVR
jgi:hypothetical protein